MNIIPTVGSAGVYKFATPFDTLAAVGEIYSCQSIRKLSEIFANNEDPKSDIYDKYGLDEATFLLHKQVDIEIAALRSEKGHWLYVPVSFIQSYPDPNGIEYRGVALSILLPAIPVAQDLEYVTDTLKQATTSMLGMNCTIKKAFTTRPLAVGSDKHKSLMIERKLRIAGNTNYFGMYTAMKVERDALAVKVAELESYILAHMPPPAP